MMIKMFRPNIWRGLVFNLRKKKLLKITPKKCNKKNLQDEGESSKMIGFDGEKKVAEDKALQNS